MMGSRLTPRLNIWVEDDDRVVLSRWRVALLEAIAAEGSISAAAERLEVPYRRAWERLAEMEAGLGIALVDRQMGGQGGGGARLTAAGEDYVARFNRFAEGIEELVGVRFREAFGDL